jgi:hypothetical protein
MAGPDFVWGGESASFNNLQNMKDPTVFGPAIVYSKIAPGPTALINPLTGAVSPTRGLLAASSGVVTGQDAFGNSITGVPVVNGYNPISVGMVTSITGPTGCWGVW